MTYQIRWASPARRAIEHTLPEAVAAAVWEFAVGPLADNPHRVGKPLREPLAGFWSARRGQYRVIYVIDDDAHVVTIAAVDHRRDVYR
jgi:mRNA interferase RelE/StbE